MRRLEGWQYIGALGLCGLKVAESDIQVVARLRAVAECEDHPVAGEEDKFLGSLIFSRG